MTSGGTPFDIDPREKLPRHFHSRPYVLIVAVFLALVLLFVVYAVYQYNRLRVATGPIVQARANGSLLVAWETVRPCTSDVVVNMADQPGGVRSQTIRVRPHVEGGLYVADLPQTLIVHPYSRYWINSSTLLFHREEGPWAITQPMVSQPFKFAVFAEHIGMFDPRHLASQIVQSQPQLTLYMHYPGVVRPSATGLRSELPPGPFFYRQLAILANIMAFMPVASGAGGERQEIPFVLPRNGPEGVGGLSYWFDYGTARFVVIDSGLPPDVMVEKVVPWLEHVLTDTRMSWKFVLMRGAVYDDTPAGESLRRVLVPVFERVHVSIVFQGQGHLYQRTDPLLDGKAVGPGEGVVYVTDGVVAGPREPAAAREYVAAVDDRVRSFTFVELAGNDLHLRQIAENGQVVDEWSSAR